MNLSNGPVQMHKYPLLLTIVLASSLMGCFSTSDHRALVNSSMASPSATIPSNHGSVLAQLEKQYSSWQGAPYKIGGNNKDGVDCSGFVHQVFKKGLGITVPRSTALLSESGNNVSTKKLRPGDLVFFKTGSDKRHVGIYLKNGQFMHASSSKGVMKSHMDNPYWAKHYWKSSRVF